MGWVPRVPFVRMTRIKLLFLDNWDMYRRVTHSTREGRNVKKSTMLHAIVTAEELIDNSLFPGDAPTRSLFKLAAESTWRAVDSIPSESEIDTYLFYRYTGFMLEARDSITRLWDRPAEGCDQQTTGKSIMISHPVHSDLSASSKVDMEECYTRMEETLGDDFKIFVEDWACFAISSNLQSRNPDGWLKYCFWGGELHRQMHTNDAIVHVWWEHVIKPSAMLLQRNEVKLKFSADDYNSKEQFVRLVAVAVYKWLLSLTGAREDVLLDPKRLLAQTKENLPAHELVHFLIYGGTFALSDKAAMRTSTATDLDWAWPYTSVLARACNKTNYAKYGVMIGTVS